MRLRRHTDHARGTPNILSLSICLLDWFRSSLRALLGCCFERVLIILSPTKRSIDLGVPGLLLMPLVWAHVIEHVSFRSCLN